MSFYIHSDANTKDIVAKLRKHGAIVLYFKAVSRTKGVPDLIVCFGGQTYFVEIKNAKGKLSPEQEAWHAAAAGIAGPIVTCRTAEEAMIAVGIEPAF